MLSFAARIINLSLSLLLSECHKVSFTATIVPDDLIPPSQKCFGPFNTNVSIPYTNVTLNHGGGYNPSLGRKHTHTHTHTHRGSKIKCDMPFSPSWIKALCKTHIIPVQLTLHLPLQVPSLLLVPVTIPFPTQSTHMWNRMTASTIK